MSGAAWAALCHIYHPILDAHEYGYSVAGAKVADSPIAEHVSYLLWLHIVRACPGGDRDPMPDQVLPELFPRYDMTCSRHWIPLFVMMIVEKYGTV